jgi:3-keto-disaccharide hydrolase
MHSRIIPAAFIVVICLAVVIGAQEKAFLGKWDITATADNGTTYPYWLKVDSDNGKLVGYFLNRSGSVLKLPEISIQNGELVFSPSSGNPSARKQVHRAKIVGDRLIGTMTDGERTVKWVGVRPPRWKNHNANRKREYGPTVELFNGKDLDNWEVQYPNRPSGWSVVDGAMTNSEGANNLFSKQKFANFKVQAEYKVDAKSNSGIYLRGRYELQVLDDAGKEPESHGHMAIYSRVAPSVNASKPAGEWQTMEATLIGNSLTVILNGKTVHDNAEIDGITGGALDSNEAAPGPIMLQGDHGKVWFRKVTITPVLK